MVIRSTNFISLDVSRLAFSEAAVPRELFQAILEGNWGAAICVFFCRHSLCGSDFDDEIPCNGLFIKPEIVEAEHADAVAIDRLLDLFIGVRRIYWYPTNDALAALQQLFTFFDIHFLGIREADFHQSC